MDLETFQSKIGVSFKSIDFLTEALTHSSYSKKVHKGKLRDNERLEFFGDAVLKLLVSEYLFHRFDRANEGVLTRYRSRLVADKHLSVLAGAIGLGDFIRFSYGEEQTGGATRLSNLANAFEALLGAIYLDQGLEAVRGFLLPLMDAHSESILEGNDVDDYKSWLQEWLQGQSKELPVYRVVREDGPDHEKTFFVEVDVDVDGKAGVYSGSGPTKKDAEQDAAKQVFLVVDC